MQFAVPQFTEVEDRLIGSLTLKQFLVLLGAGGIIMFFWSILGATPIFFIVALPIAIVGVGSALGRYNGRAMFTYLMPFISFVSSDKVMVFKRESVDISVANNKVVKTHGSKDSDQNPELLEPAESRLKKLAYALDRKTQEETDILSQEPVVTQPEKPAPSIVESLSKLLPKKTTAHRMNKIAAAPKIDLSENLVGKVKPNGVSLNKVQAKLAAVSERLDQPAKTVSEKPVTKKFDPNSIFK